MGDGHCNSNGKNKGKKNKNKKKKRTVDQSIDMKYLNEWVSLDSQVPVVDDFQEFTNQNRFSDNLVFELHCHSICSDGFLSPSAVVERAYRRGVKVLALTDHDTMAGIPEALEAARKCGIRIIPGVEISTIFSPGGDSGPETPVHILAYYGSCGPGRYEELEACLSKIREGRYLRAKDILSKLNNLKMPLKWEHVAKIAGKGVAPGRLHVARAMVEAGHVENLRQAFNRYLYDGGPAYATGSEPLAEEAIQMIHRTGGVAALAHPWALKKPIAVIQRLKKAGLHAMEVYRSDGKLAGFSELAEAHELIKLGGSDYHGRGSQDESDLGSVKLPITAIYEFLKLSQPIWFSAMKNVLTSFARDPTDSNLEKILKFGKIKFPKDPSVGYNRDFFDICLSTWLTKEERQTLEVEDLMNQLSQTVIKGPPLCEETT